MKKTLLRWGRMLALLSIPMWGQAGILPGPLVETRWLADNAQAVQIVEVRASAKSFVSAPEVTVDKKGKKAIEEIGGHIPGSVLANPKNMRVDRMKGGLKVQYMIPEAPDFEKYLRQSGLVAGKPIVLVPIGQDLADINDTLRLYWQLKVYGEDEVAVLNGGYAAWLLEGRDHSLTPPSANGNYSLKGDRTSQYMASSDDVQKNIESKSATLVDGRDAQQFHGLVTRNYVYSPGHIPGARLYPSELMLRNAGGALKFLPPQTYRALLSAQGIDPQAAAITYCNSGHLASGPWFVMSELLGNSKVRLYDGSLHEWTLEKRTVMGAVPL